MPIHTVYVGGDAGPRGFDFTTPDRLAEDARAFFRGALADPARLESICGLDDPLAQRVAERVAVQLDDSPLDDLRVDFEDGYSGSDAEADARRAGFEAATTYFNGGMPAGFGLRIPSMAEAKAERSRHILELLLGSMLEELEELPEGFVVTLAKIDDPEEIERLADALDDLEEHRGLDEGSIPVELMAETPRSVYDADGRLAVPGFVAAARGRCLGIHFGMYDYTSSLGLVAGQQRLRHSACDAARAALQIGVAAVPGVELSDGSSRVVPRLDMGDDELASAIRGVYDDVRHSLEHGIYRGWDMAGSHVAIRRVAVTAFFLEALPEMRRRWREAGIAATAASNDLEDSDDLEDAATVRAMRAFFERGLDCGALVAEDVPG